MAVEKITESNFREKVLENKGTVLLDFWATWCGPCRMMSPVVDEIAKDHPEIFVGKVNVDEEEALSRQFNIFSIPTFIILKDGKVQAQTAGARPKAALEAMLFANGEPVEAARLAEAMRIEPEQARELLGYTE